MTAPPGGGSGPNLDLTPLVNATSRLREGLERQQREPNDDQLRDGLTRQTPRLQRLIAGHERRVERLVAARDELGAAPAEHVPEQDARFERRQSGGA